MRVVTPAQLAELAAGAEGTREIAEAVFWSSWGAPHYYYVLAELLPTLHATMCKYLGAYAV